MPQAPLLSILVARVLLPSLDNQLIEVLPYKGESELSEHCFCACQFSGNRIPQFIAYFAKYLTRRTEMTHSKNSQVLAYHCLSGASKKTGILPPFCPSVAYPP